MDEHAAIVVGQGDDVTCEVEAWITLVQFEKMEIEIVATFSTSR